jgi:hypothetical protein
MGMALGVSGEMADENCKLRDDHSNHGEVSGQIDRKRPGIAASPEPPGLVFCTNAHKEEITSCWGTVAELDCEAENGDEKKRASSCAVPFLFVLVFLGAKSFAKYGSLVRQMSAPGEVKEQVYISRGAPSREPKKSSFAPSWAIY